MPVLPDTILGKIQFGEARVTPWTDNAVDMGSSSAAVTDWHSKLTAVRAAFNAQQAAELVRKNTTNDLRVAMDAYLVATASIIKSVRSKADVAGPSVYSLASLPVPTPPAPTPAPGKPTDLSVFLDETGVLSLKWKCPNPSGTRGTQYAVWRQIDGGTLEFLASVGEKLFVDDSLPAGSKLVMYQIQASRSTAVGLWATFNVRFGIDSSGGAVVASVTPGPAPKMAA